MLSVAHTRSPYRRPRQPQSNGRASSRSDRRRAGRAGRAPTPSGSPPTTTRARPCGGPSPGSTNACAVAVLGLASNDIGDRGTTELAPALLDNETLVCVDLRRNRIGGAGALDLRKLADVNDMPEELLLEGNNGN